MHWAASVAATQTKTNNHSFLSEYMNSTHESLLCSRREPRQKMQHIVNACYPREGGRSKERENLSNMRLKF